MKLYAVQWMSSIRIRNGDKISLSNVGSDFVGVIPVFKSRTAALEYAENQADLILELTQIPAEQK